ncbi:hypothetical protein BDC45DRAFT_573148 [Circinella umbellata]|nr:hypothetical protein BDC45DRAFT_573148 [Circinella umbellata]
MDSAPVYKQEKTTDVVDDFLSNNTSQHRNDEYVVPLRYKLRIGFILVKNSKKTVAN